VLEWLLSVILSQIGRQPSYLLREQLLNQERAERGQQRERDSDHDGVPDRWDARPNDPRYR
jgi:hypothetical protein